MRGKNIKKKILVVLSILFLVWYISPIPEITLIGSILFGSITRMVVDNPWIIVAVFVASFGIGTLVVRKLRLVEKVKEKFSRGGR